MEDGQVRQAMCLLAEEDLTWRVAAGVFAAVVACSPLCGNKKARHNRTGEGSQGLLTLGEETQLDYEEESLEEVEVVDEAVHMKRHRWWQSGAWVPSGGG
ncbi:hypothetical protein NDU88_002695 [Pleurodeles waltl]|uniref:Uncharacterized protein n=1 Tax=Pleurodeles waltl TaxID=8319 RepID=A0AAV7MSE7_PLEWA|nr:hypothetical protein NDU88_002695 [Pleurodeles waltl]